MLTIYKYPIKINNIVEIDFPLNSKILTAEYDAKIETIVIYALINKNELMTEKRYIRIFCTGEKITINTLKLKYTNTVKLYNDQIILHIFEEYKQ